MTLNGPYSPGNWPEGSFFKEMEEIDKAECWHKIYGDYTNYKKKSSRFARQVSNGMKLTGAVMSANLCKPTVESPIKRVREFLKNLLTTLCNNEGSFFPHQWNFTNFEDFCEHPTYSSTSETGVGNHQFMSAYRVVITFEYHQFEVLEETIAEKSIERMVFEEQRLSVIASNFPAKRFEVAKNRFQNAHAFFKLLIEKCIDMLYGFGVHWKLRDEEKHQQDLLNFEKKNVLRVASWNNVDFSVVKRALTKRSTSEDVEEEPPKKLSVEEKPIEEPSPWISPFTSKLLQMTMNENGLQVLFPDDHSEEINHNKMDSSAQKFEQGVIESTIESVRATPEAHSEVVVKEEEAEQEELFLGTIHKPTSSLELTERLLKVDLNANEKAKVLTECTPSPSSVCTQEEPEASSAQSSPSSSENHPQPVSFRLQNHRMAKMKRLRAMAKQEFDEEKEREKEREKEIDKIVAFSEKFHANQQHPMFDGRLRHFHIFDKTPRICEMMFGDMAEKWKNEYVLNASLSVITKALQQTRDDFNTNGTLRNLVKQYFGELNPEAPAPFKTVKEFVEAVMDDIFFVNINDEEEELLPKNYKLFDLSIVTNPDHFHPRNVRVQWFGKYDVTPEDRRYLILRMEALARHIMSDVVRTVFIVKEDPSTGQFHFHLNRYFDIPQVSD